MKIPTYRSKVQQTDQIVAQPFNVQVNSGVMEAEGQAVAGFKNNFDAAAQWMVTEQKLENATEVSKGERSFAAELEAIQTKIEANPKFNSKPEKISKEFDRQALLKRNLISKSVNGSLAKTTFLTNARTTQNTNRLKIKQTARVRLTAESITEKLIESEEIQKKLSDLDPKLNPVDYQIQSEKLFGNPTKNIKGIFESLVDLGHLNEKQAYTYIKSAKNKISVQQVEKGLLSANQLSLSVDDMDNGVAAKAVRNVQLRIQNGDYPDLTVQAKQNLLERADKLMSQLVRARNAEQTRVESSAAKNLKTGQSNRYVAFASSIIKANKDPNNREAQTTKPSLGELQIALEQRDITPVHYNNLIQQLNNVDAAVPNRNFYNDTLRKIRVADTKQEIENLVTNAYAQLSPTAATPINREMMTTIEQRAEQFVTKTPEAIATKKFGELLKALTDPSGILDKIMGGSSERAALVMFTFDAQISENGKTPQEAFRMAIDQFNISDKANLNAIPLPLFPPFQEDEQKVSRGFSQTNILKTNLKDWTIEDIQNSRKETLRKFEGKPSLLGSELFKLKMLEKYLVAKDPALLAAQAEQAKLLAEKQK